MPLKPVPANEWPDGNGCLRHLEDIHVVYVATAQWVAYGCMFPEQIGTGTDRPNNRISAPSQAILRTQERISTPVDGWLGADENVHSFIVPAIAIEADVRSLVQRDSVFMIQPAT